MCYREVEYKEVDAFSSPNRSLCEASSAVLHVNEGEVLLDLESLESAQCDAGLLTHGLYVVSDDGLTLRFCYWNDVMHDKRTDKEAIHA